MDDAKQGYRDAKSEVKEQARKIDGDSPADALGNLGDDIKDTVGNVGDDLDAELDRPRGDDPTTRP
jgi:hypothetical protein